MWRRAFVSLLLLGLSAGAFAQQAAEMRIPPQARGQLERGEEIRVLVHVAEEESLLPETERRSLRVKPAVRQAIKSRMLNAVADRHLSVLRQYDQLPMLAMRVRSVEALERLAARAEVLEIYEDVRLYPILGQSLPLIGQPAASVAGQQGGGAAVAVLDTGLDYTRSEFGNCSAPGVPSSCRVAYAADTATDDAALDDNGHGTMVSGIVTGVAPATRLLAFDVFDGGSASSVDVVEAINWVIANRATYNIVAINMSLGGTTKYTSPCVIGNPFRVAINAARAAGVISVVASGNEGYTDGLSMPACTPDAVSVGAVYDANVGALNWSGCSDSTTAADMVACFSNGASMLDLLAPGALISVVGSSGGGTSFAAPHAAGALAVLRGARPAESTDVALSRLLTYGKPVTDARNGVTTPRVDLLAALQLPANDAFSSASLISGSSGTVSGSSDLASGESGEPAHAGASPIRSVWWKWTAPMSGDASFATTGSLFDTVLAAYSGDTVNALTVLAQNDNASSGLTTSSITFRAAAGMTYYLAVAGNLGASGTVKLNWGLVEPLADLAISLTATPDPVVAGDPVTYRATVTNLGPYAAESVLLEIAVPVDAAISSVSSGCTPAVGSVACDLGNLAVGEVATRDVVLVAAAAGSLTVSAKVDGSWGDPVSANDVIEASAVVSAPPVSDEDGDVPLPAWALALLGLTLLRTIRLRQE